MRYRRESQQAMINWVIRKAFLVLSTKRLTSTYGFSQADLTSGLFSHRSKETIGKVIWVKNGVTTGQSEVWLNSASIWHLIKQDIVHFWFTSENTRTILGLVKTKKYVINTKCLPWLTWTSTARIRRPSTPISVLSWSNLTDTTWMTFQKKPPRRFRSTIGWPGKMGWKDSQRRWFRRSGWGGATTTTKSRCDPTSRTTCCYPNQDTWR